jgi:hypothetical protein
MPFDQWLAEVNQIIEDEYGLSLADLPDCSYRDWFDDDLSPEEAAAEAIENAQ